MKDRVIVEIKKSFQKLMENDGSLFEFKGRDDANDIYRKLHEVCINHKLANYLEEFIHPLLYKYHCCKEGHWYTDIEFNRKGINYKELTILKDEKAQKRVRPDIIIHNRKSEEDKINFLVVECKKKSSSSAQDRAYDQEKLKALLSDETFKYEFALQVIYDRQSVSGILYERSFGEIRADNIQIPPQ